MTKLSVFVCLHFIPRWKFCVKCSCSVPVLSSRRDIGARAGELQTLGGQIKKNIRGLYVCTFTNNEVTGHEERSCVSHKETLE